MVVLHFDDQLRLQRLPLGAALRAPAARTARRAARETRWLNQRLDDPRDLLTIRALEARRESNMMQEAVVVIKPQQQRPHELRPFAVAKPAHHAVRRPPALDFLHSIALAAPIRQIEPLGNNAVQVAARRSEPLFRLRQAIRPRREANLFMACEIALSKAI